MAIAILPDGSKRELPDGSTVMQLAESIGQRAGQGRGRRARWTARSSTSRTRSPASTRSRSSPTRTPTALLVLRHSTAHVMAEAIQRLWPRRKLAYGPAAGERLLLRHRARHADLAPTTSPKIEAEMAKIVAENGRSPATSCRPTKGMERLKQRGQQVQGRQRRARDRRRGRQPSAGTSPAQRRHRTGKTSAWARTCRAPGGSRRSR